MRNLIIIVLIFFVHIFFACTNHEANMQKIGDFVAQSIKELKQMQLDSTIRYKEFNFEGQKFRIFFDSTGKPVFVDENLNKIDYTTIEFKDQNYKLQLEVGKLEISLY